MASSLPLNHQRSGFADRTSTYRRHPSTCTVEESRTLRSDCRLPPSRHPAIPRYLPGPTSIRQQQMASTPSHRARSDTSPAARSSRPHNPSQNRSETHQIPTRRSPFAHPRASPHAPEGYDEPDAEIRRSFHLQSSLAHTARDENSSSHEETSSTWD